VDWMIKKGSGDERFSPKPELGDDHNDLNIF
jgi:hypothetical protein